jgi:L-lactate utilization protein LutC
MTARGTETGDRAAFLGRLRAQLAAGVPVNHAHPAPAPRPDPPAVVHHGVGDDLVVAFERAAADASATTYRSSRAAMTDVLERLIELLEVRRAVVSDEPEIEPLAVALAARGVALSEPTRAACAAADLGVTAALAGIAATGSVVIDTGASGRIASLLPRAHLCVVPVTRLVPDPSAVFRSYTGRAGALPSQLVVITGPSRTGDIEQLLTLGVHGPLELHVLLVE